MITKDLKCSVVKIGHIGQLFQYNKSNLSRI